MRGAHALASEAAKWMAALFETAVERIEAENDYMRK